MNGLDACKRQNRTTGAGAMIAQSVADILRHHVKLAIEGIDRMYLNVFVPRLQHEMGIVGFFREHRGQPLPSAALMQPMSRAFEALDNGVLSCAAPARLQKICDGLSAEKIDGFLRNWLRLLPHPFTGADRKAGYRYAISILQAEFSLTQVLDQPVHGRLFFEQVIRENLDLGRPEQVQLIFNRKINRQTPGLFRTRVLTQDVTPSLNVYYKNAHIKQYHKENRALRTETTINNTYDFAIGKRLHNLPKLREVGFAANRRLLDVERLSHDCMLTEDTFQTINGPVAAGRQRASGLRFADARTQSLLHGLIPFRLLPNGFRCADLRRHLAILLGRDLESISQGAITYQLRRLRLHGLIERVPNSFRYRVTKFGLRVALFFTR